MQPTVIIYTRDTAEGREAQMVSFYPISAYPGMKYAYVSGLYRDFWPVSGAGYQVPTNHKNGDCVRKFIRRMKAEGWKASVLRGGWPRKRQDWPDVATGSASYADLICYGQTGRFPWESAEDAARRIAA